MGSGLIYATVIGLWALVLLPMWKNNHERQDHAKQVDRFRHAMRQLSTSHVELLTDTTHKQVTAKRAPAAGTLAPTPLTPVARRRRVLAVLACVEAVGAVATVLGAGTLPLLIPAVFTALFLVLARSQVRRERARRAPMAAAPQRSTSFTRSLAAARMARSARGRAISDVDVVEQAPAAPTVDQRWAPVQTPAPSYVSAPAASTLPRAIDSGAGWTGSAMVEAARSQSRATADMAAAPTAVEALGTAPASVDVDADVTTEIPVIRITA